MITVYSGQMAHWIGDTAAKLFKAAGLLLSLIVTFCRRPQYNQSISVVFFLARLYYIVENPHLQREEENNDSSEPYSSQKTTCSNSNGLPGT
jgi:hypothetical protein